MPIIIENLRLRLMEEADLQVRRGGYGSMTVRSVAAALLTWTMAGTGFEELNSLIQQLF